MNECTVTDRPTDRQINGQTELTKCIVYLHRKIQYGTWKLCNSLFGLRLLQLLFSSDTTALLSPFYPNNLSRHPIHTDRTTMNENNVFVTFMSESQLYFWL